MRYMMLMIPKVYRGKRGRKIGADFSPGAEEVAMMTKFNEELAKAGVLIGLDGLHPILRGARVTFAGGKTRVTDGPYTESKEVLGGYWIINVKSKEEAIAWARKCPAQDGDVIEIRQVFEASDFPADVRKAAASPTIQSHLDRHRTRTYL